MFWPVTVARRIDRQHGETALGHETARTVHDARGLLVLSAAVPHHDQGADPVGTFRSPQHTRDVAEEKDLFKDAAGRRLSGEAHSVSGLSGCLLRTLPRPGKERAPTCHSVDRSHLLSSQAAHGGAEPIAMGCQKRLARANDA